MCCGQNFLENEINEFKNKGYKFNHIAEMNIITIANKLGLSYAFSIKHDIPAVEGNLNALINKDKSLINKVNRNWRHPLIRKLEHVPLNEQQIYIIK